MDNLSINNSNEIVMPGSNTNSVQGNEDLMSADISEAIQSKKIKSVLIKSDAELMSPSYILDMTEVENITEESFKAIQGILSGGDTALYIKSNNNVNLVGYGDGQLLYSVLDGIIKHMYNAQCKMYKHTTKGTKLVRESEVDSIRLNL